MYGNYNNIARAPFIKSTHFGQFTLQRKRERKRKNLEKNYLVCRNLDAFVRETKVHPHDYVFRFMPVKLSIVEVSATQSYI